MINPHNKTKGHKSIIFTSRKCRKRVCAERVSKGKFYEIAPKKLRERATAAELAMCKKLTELGIEYYFQATVVAQGRNSIHAIMDFHLIKENLYLEIDGGYHNSETQKQTDAIKEFICFKLHKRRVLRITNEDAISITLEDLSKWIKDQQGGLCYQTLPGHQPEEMNQTDRQRLATLLPIRPVLSMRASALQADRLS